MKHLTQSHEYRGSTEFFPEGNKDYRPLTMDYRDLSLLFTDQMVDFAVIRIDNDSWHGVSSFLPVVKSSESFRT